MPTWAWVLIALLGGAVIAFVVFVAWEIYDLADFFNNSDL